MPTGAVWRFLQPVDALPILGDRENEAPRAGIVVMGMVATRPGRLVRAQTFGIGFSLHALGRLLDRSAFRADPIAAMLEAHNAVAALNLEDGERVFGLAAVELPAAAGAFLATPCRFGSDSIPMAVARTWIAGGQTFPQQDQHLEAWRRLLAGPEG
jgi:hypothetical protein